MSVFDQVAYAYDAGRPAYPDTLYDAVEKLSGLRLPGAVVLDVGAGTGISTRGLLARGARVVAIERGARMLAALRARSPHVAAVRGDGNALPLRDRVADVVAYAQAWHWTDAERSLSEAWRVLRGGGALAVWWNIPDGEAASWVRDHQRRLAAWCPDFDYYRGAHLDADAAARWGFDVRSTEIRWSRTVPLEVFLTELRSKSYVDALGAAGVEAFVASEREELPVRSPSDVLEEPYVVPLAVARKVTRKGA